MRLFANHRAVARHTCTHAVLLHWPSENTLPDEKVLQGAFFLATKTSVLAFGLPVRIPAKASGFSDASPRIMTSCQDLPLTDSKLTPDPASHYHSNFPSYQHIRECLRLAIAGSRMKGRNQERTCHSALLLVFRDCCNIHGPTRLTKATCTLSALAKHRQKCFT